MATVDGPAVFVHPAGGPRGNPASSCSAPQHVALPQVSPPLSPNRSIKGKGKAVDYEPSSVRSSLSRPIGKEIQIDGVRFTDMLERDRWMVDEGQRPKYKLKIRQHPQRARLCSYKEENDTIDRRPIDPPVVVEVCTDETDSSELLEACNLFIKAIIVHSDPLSDTTPSDFEQVKTPTGADATAGEVVQTPEKLRGLNGALGAYCIFAKVGARIPGVFRVKTTLYETSINGVAEVASAVSDKFEVFSPKLFTGMLESTPLTRHFAAQGLKIKLRPQKQQTEARQRGKLATSAIKKSSSSRTKTPASDVLVRGVSATSSFMSSGFSTPKSSADLHATSPVPPSIGPPKPAFGWANGWNSTWDRCADREEGWREGTRATGDDGTFMAWDSMPALAGGCKVSPPPPPSSMPLFYPPVSNARVPSGGFPSIDLSRFSLSASALPSPNPYVEQPRLGSHVDAILARSNSSTPLSTHSLPPLMPHLSFTSRASSSSPRSFSLQSRTSAARSEPRAVVEDRSRITRGTSMYRDDGLPTCWSSNTLRDTEMSDRPVVPRRRPTKPSVSSLLRAEE